MNTIIYCRISTPEQSLEAQEHACIEYCREHNLRIIDIIYEIGSAYKSKQPKLNKLIKDNNNITVVIYSIDRFSRNLVSTDRLLNIMSHKQINLVSVKEQLDLGTPIGRHNFRNHISQAQLESEIIGQRIRNNIKYKRDNGLYIGMPSYGYKVVNGKKELDTKEQAVIKFISDTINREMTTVIFTDKLYKLLNIFEKTEDYYIPVEFNNDNEIIDKSIISAEMIADILNDYEVLKRGKFWNMGKVRNLYNSLVINITNINL